MTTLGRYQVLDKLGEGAMGVVYRARDRTLGRVVALKMLTETLGEDDELHQRFQREVETVGRLDHPNIVAVFDMGESDGQLYMAMELLEGEDLRSLVERRVDVPLADRVRIALEICAGLGHAHAQGVVHRDVKPANILVTTRGQVKLLDFGLARVAAWESITRQGVILGTPDYMSPEQASGGTVDQRTDLFATGSVLYEFLTWRKPFPGKTLHAVLYEIVSHQPVPVLRVNPDVPARLAHVIHRMLEKDTERRYAHMEDVARDLRPIHAALRRSDARSAHFGSQPVPADAHLELRRLLDTAKGHLAASRRAEAVFDLKAALAVDPHSEEAATGLWEAQRSLLASPLPSTADPTLATRVLQLLADARAGQPQARVQRALDELTLIAPDDPRVVERLYQTPARKAAS